jgi:hypothetical protein
MAKDEVKKFINRKFTQQRRKELHTIERNKKSATLRKYAKLCVKEGIVSNRVKTDNTKTTGDDSITDIKSNGKKPIVNPFETAIKIANTRKEEAKRQQEERLLRQREVAAAKKQRDSKRKLHMKRTKSGQPLLGEKIKGMLSKLQSTST